MAVTYAVFDPSKSIGGQLATAVDYLSRGYSLYRDAKASIDAVTSGGSSTSGLVGGNFGALDEPNAQLMWDACYTVEYVLNTARDGGLLQALGALNKGTAGT